MYYVLHLAHNQINSAGLASLVKYTKSLKHLYINSNPIDFEGIKFISSYFLNLKRLSI